MAAALKLDILTPHGPKRRDLDVAGVEIPGLLGELGALPQHEAFITAVTPGVVRFKEDGKAVRIAVGAGFLEITHDGRAIILVERAAEVDEIEVDAAREALQEAASKLGGHQGAIDTAEYRVLAQERDWLEAQLRAAGA